MTAVLPNKTPFFRSAARAIKGTVVAPASVNTRGWGTAQVTVVFIVGALNLIGLAMVLSASSVTSLYQGTDTWFHFTRQAIWVSLGMVALLGFRHIDYQSLRKLVPLGLLVTFVMLVAVLIPGVGVGANGSTRWLAFGPVTAQPTEILKLVILLYAADLLSRRQGELNNPSRTLVPILVVFGAAGILIMLQPDLGSVIIAGGITVAVLFAGGVSLAPLALCTFVGGSLAVVLTMTASYRRARLLAFLDPWEDPLSTSYQTVQSMVGIANGGVTGVGVGQGRAKWGFLPESHTDFIFAVVAEEMGFVGAVLVLTMFVTLAVVGVRIAQRAPDRFGTLTAIGIVVWLLLQAIVNVGGVVGAMPITGVTLPFVSFGGTSTVVGMAAVGVLLNIGRQGQA